MASSNGNFVWYDLMSTDAKAAEAFYRGVVGWRMQDAGMPDRSVYDPVRRETAVGGLMPLPPDSLRRGREAGLERLCRGRRWSTPSRRG